MALVRSVAKALNKADLKINKTDRFLVTAADTSDGVEIAEDLKACVPPALLKKIDLTGYS